MRLPVHTWSASRRSCGHAAPWHGVACTATRLVGLLGADDDDRIVEVGRHAVDDPLRAGRGLAAHDADRLELVDALRQRQERRYGAERLAAEVEVEPGTDHPASAEDEVADHADDAGIEELDLIDPHDAGVGREQRHDLGARAHRPGDERIAVVRTDELGTEAIVDRGLEGLDGAARDDGALHASDELLALSAEHAPHDDLEPTLLVVARGHAGANAWERSRKRPAAPPSGRSAC